MSLVRRAGAPGIRRRVRSPPSSVPLVKPWLEIPTTDLILALDARIGFAPSLWEDQSSQANDVEQLTASKQASHVQDGGLDAIDFDGVDDFYKRAGWTGLGAGASLTCIAVCKVEGGGGNDGIIESTGSAGNPDNGFLIGDLGSEFHRVSGTVLWDITDPSDGNYHIRTIHHSTSAMEAFIDGVSIGTQTGTNTVPAQLDLHIGQRSNNGSFLDGKCRSILCYKAKLSSGDLTTLTDSLKDVWEIS